MPEIILYGISVLSFAGLAVMVYGYTTAPEGYEDKYGFHYGRSPKVNASRRRVAVRSRHNAKHRTRCPSEGCCVTGPLTVKPKVAIVG